MISETLDVAPAENVFAEGEPSHSVYVVEAGEIEIWTTTHGKRARLALLGPGQLFGESGVLEARKRSATATATVRARLLRIDGSTFAAGFGLGNSAALNLFKMVCARLRSTNQQLVEVMAQSAKDALPEVSRFKVTLTPDSDVLRDTYGMAAVAVDRLPFVISNKYGSEATPLPSLTNYVVAAFGKAELSCPHFSIEQHRNRIEVHDLGSRHGTWVNGTKFSWGGNRPAAELREGENHVTAGHAESPFRFVIAVYEMATLKGPEPEPEQEPD
ncbi:MAG TPA: cyclic nucleotide-binding domain-containing protein [Stellaceae bacterium]|nr:cyclic nucleotide-binding domain-containing protein [Stellaceae bacterium]